MRRTIVIAMIAAIGGFCVASAPAFAVLKFTTWNQAGEQFQLGYVIGYLDAIQLSQRKDVRAQVPTGGGKNYDRWVRDMNVFFANPQNQIRAVPDGMYEVGAQIRAEWLKDFQTRNPKNAVSPSPSPAPE